MATGKSECEPWEIVSNYFGQVIKPKKEVKDINELHKGQHVAFKRPNYWHHGIVEKKEDTAIHTIEYNLKIMRRVHDFGGEEKFYVVEDDQGDKTVEELDEIVERAIESMRKQDNYNPLYRNCEHFANSCSKGEEASGQSEQYWRMLVLLIGRILVEICLFLFQFGMLSFLAEFVPFPGRTEEENKIFLALIFKGGMAALLEIVFMAYDFCEHFSCSRWKKVCQAFLRRFMVAFLSIGFMLLFSWLALTYYDINSAGAALLAGSFGTLLGYGIVVGIGYCIGKSKNEKTWGPFNSTTKMYFAFFLIISTAILYSVAFTQENWGKLQIKASTVAAQCFAAISQVCIMIAVMLAFAYLTYPKKGRSSILAKIYAGSCICSCFPLLITVSVYGSRWHDPFTSLTTEKSMDWCMTLAITALITMLVAAIITGTEIRFSCPNCFGKKKEPCYEEMQCSEHDQSTASGPPDTSNQNETQHLRDELNRQKYHAVV